MPKKSNRILLYDEEKVKLINPETLKLWNKYEVDMSLRELSPKTISGYKSDAVQWFIYILDNQSNQSIKDLDEDDVTEFLYYCKQQGNNSRRMKRRMSTISAFYIFLKKKRIIKENPMEYIDRPKNDTRITVQTFLTEEQVSKISECLQNEIDNAKNTYQKAFSLMLKLYVDFSMSTMARVNAVRNITWDKIDYDKRIVAGVLEKEQRIVDLMFSKKVEEELRYVFDFRKQNKIDDGGYVFFSKTGGELAPITSATADDWCKKVGAMIGAPTLHPHDFRHSSATLLKNKGMSLEEVSSLLGHKSTEVTRAFYIKEDKTKLQDAKDKFESEIDDHGGDSNVS